MRRHGLTTATALLVVLAGSATAGERLVQLDPQQTRISFELGATGHDVHGTLALQAGEIRFDPETGEASGSIAIDARNAESGNKKRDKTMHAKVLESETFPLFEFTASRLEGGLSEGQASDLNLIGTLSIHGEEHPFTMPIRVTADGDRFQAAATFPIPYVAWGMHDPSFLFLRVAKEVAVTVETAGTIGNGGTRASIETD